MSESEKKPKEYPKIGYRGFTLAKWGYVFSFYITTLAFVVLLMGQISGSDFVYCTLAAVSIAGIGSGGHQLGNFAERWRGNMELPE